MKSCHAISVTNYFKEKKTNTFSVNIGPQMNMELNVTNVLGSFNLNRPLTIIRKPFIWKKLKIINVPSVRNHSKLNTVLMSITGVFITEETLDAKNVTLSLNFMPIS